MRQTTIKYLKEYVENNYIYDISMQEARRNGIFRCVFQQIV